MLVQLQVRNLVLIENLVLELRGGFNVLTGETGAGKSMIIDALSLVLGGRARADLIRAGAREAEVEALFEIPAGSRVLAKLEAAGIPFDGTTGGGVALVVRRLLQSEGGESLRTRAYVNGRLCTAAQLAELAPDLCDIASQHESVSLTDPATHVEYLDAFGKLDAARDALAEEVDALAAVVKELEAVRESERGRAEREDFLAFQLRELDELSPEAGEETSLDQERARLRHAERLTQATAKTAERLYEGEGAICDELGRLAADVDGAASLDGSLAPLARQIESARSELADAARALARYAEGVEVNPQRLAEVEERLFRLQKLLRKHGPTTTELLAHRDTLRRELDGLEGSSARATELESARDARLGKASSRARTLSQKRRQAAEKLADAVGRELAQLGMGRARVVVEVAPIATGSAEAALQIDGARLTRSGIDRVEFLIAPNKGEEPRPMRRIASGGELSRALLALKRVLAEKGPAGLYVFDEVDAGVGGAIAEVIGRSIADVARHRQVLCITHLPQIAALADGHHVVGKSEVKGRTLTTVRPLSEKERIEEVARMIGGVKVGEAARRAAEEMLAARK
ncbi:DNA repair protein RecN [Pendulispora brunnea]|uniref:DNA repair protein RecN n=1 Tax=Pendulispora brunnea TaxID=2905690 RepID=A0ABZ2KHT8_9BACT